MSCFNKKREEKANQRNSFLIGEKKIKNRNLSGSQNRRMLEQKFNVCTIGNVTRKISKIHPKLKKRSKRFMQSDHDRYDSVEYPFLRSFCISIVDVWLRR